MATEYAECPLYKSKTYYGVVLHGTHKHKGWQCYFVGDGSMHFKHENGDIKKFYRGREVDQWMEECWSEFLAEAERYNAEVRGCANTELSNGERKDG